MRLSSTRIQEAKQNHSTAELEGRSGLVLRTTRLRAHDLAQRIESQEGRWEHRQSAMLPDMYILPKKLKINKKSNFLGVVPLYWTKICFR